jgi:hypothetical protein
MRVKQVMVSIIAGANDSAVKRNANLIAAGTDPPAEETSELPIFIERSGIPTVSA